ncbi:protein kinase, putative, partial [Entamoeba invadens IP1]
SYITKLNIIKCLTCPPEQQMQNGLCKCLYTLLGTNCVLNHCVLYENGICRQCTDKYFYDEITKTCNSCGINCNKCVNSTYCYNCFFNNLIINNGVCVNSNCLLSNSGRCVKCDKGYYISNGNCVVCDIRNCDYCSTQTKCSMCHVGYYWDGFSCVNNKGFVNTNNKLIYCTSVTDYLSDGKCNNCTSDIYNCEMCMDGKCIKCLDNTIYSNGECVIESSCNSITNSLCLCNSESIYNGNACISKRENCSYDRLSGCDECIEDHHLVSNTCTPQVEPNCSFQMSSTCISCDFGMYLEDGGNCAECPIECTSCISNSKCISCTNDKYLQDHTCISSDELSKVCDKPLLTGSGCAICKSGYYRSGNGCNVCNTGCATCTNNIKCTTCQSDYFMTYDEGVCKLKNSTVGCVDINTVLGCISCTSGYYLYHKDCAPCSENCNQCTSQTTCQICESDFVLVNSKCTSLELVKDCVKVSESKCSKCTFWRSPSIDGSSCVTKAVWWVIFIIVLIVILLFIILLIVIVVITKMILDKLHKKEVEKTTTIFEMKKSNIHFETLQGGICVSSKTVDFNSENDEIPVNTESREVFCVGNLNENVVKIQFTLMSNVDKFTLRVSPELISLKKGFACEFSMYLTPLCTCQIISSIQIVAKNLKTNDEKFNAIKVIGVTEKSTRIDYDELKEDKKLGEGSFGVVYKGTFRGNIVAIKKMKNFSNDDNSIEEFTNEVNMLNKFRSDFIVHFYGAVFIPSKVCLVTEFAQFGSLKDLMQHKKSEEECINMRIKMLVDSSKGIAYLHENGILHRDIKPDNILVVSIDLNDSVNAKLTDFGSSRNINLLMTNMTFTKGIGTPIYMAPEMLRREKYKKSADVYSFGVTMYEVVGWKEPFNKEQFKYSWDIVDFVVAGKRLEKPMDMRDDIFIVIQEAWCDDKNKRRSINNIQKSLETILNVL